MKLNKQHLRGLEIFEAWWIHDSMKYKSKQVIQNTQEVKFLAEIIQK